jgi:1,4-dihydroxy-2-naphthoate octaprenyltransferase
MDKIFGKAKKAWAGGIAGAVVAAGAYTYSGGPISSELGRFVGAVVAGFAAGFLAVYVSPKNSPTS